MNNEPGQDSFIMLGFMILCFIVFCSLATDESNVNTSSDEDSTKDFSKSPSQSVSPSLANYRIIYTIPPTQPPIVKRERPVKLKLVPGSKLNYSSKKIVNAYDVSDKLLL